MILASTTSLQDSGLLDYLIPQFQKKYRITVKTIAVGSGKALKMGENGDADAVFVHSPKKEGRFMSKGYGANRITFMHNYFVISGPKNDPAKIKKVKLAKTAFRRIARKRSIFVSRGDQSGTHMKELEIWSKARIKAGGRFYIQSGLGMGATLMLANQKNGYTLCDESTYLAFRKRVKLKILFSNSKDLMNKYSIIIVNPRNSKAVQYDLAKKFSNWITSKATKKKIARFGKKKYGKALFKIDKF
ncbi:MAG: tungsten ABC transporter substrate-binding protein [Actinobacteria bacterium]|nr:MAG: tungsten ABC transporter substrate-binding protein [Actinomycetota bacterium]